MKRILISFICGTTLFSGYYFFLFIFFQVYRVEINTLLTLLMPISLPAEIYRSISGVYLESEVAVIILNLTGSILIYSIPIYLVLTLYGKLKKKPKVKGMENPPEPPVFDT